MPPFWLSSQRRWGLILQMLFPLSLFAILFTRSSPRSLPWESFLSFYTWSPMNKMSFFLCRQIPDSVIIAHENIHSMMASQNQGFLMWICPRPMIEWSRIFYLRFWRPLALGKDVSNSSLNLLWQLLWLFVKFLLSFKRAQIGGSHLPHLIFYYGWIFGELH